MRALVKGLVAVALLGGLAGGATAQTSTTYDACYVPDVGAIYLINQPGLPTSCLATSHVAFSWTDGGTLADGSVTAVKLADGAVITIKLADGAVTEAKLGFDPATQAELDALGTSGTINTSTNPVDWTELKSVPAGFADGVDNTGGTPSDLVCTGCVGTTDLADAAVTAAKLAFDPATQAELDALGTSGTINTSTNPVDWTELKSVPAGFADGSDDTGVTDHGLLTGLADDDHAQYLLVDGVRESNGFAVTGTAFSGTIPTTGAGVRLMWYPGKAAFRAGTVDGTQWDDASIAYASVAMGRNTTAMNGYSTALGDGTTATGSASTAMGSATAASGDGSTAMGNATLAAGQASTAFGNNTTAFGPSSTAMGANTGASGEASTAMGAATTAEGAYSTAMGLNTTAQAYASFVIGRYGIAVGSPDSWVSGEALFVAGNGTSSTSRSDALRLGKDGNMFIAGTLAQASDIRLKEDVERLDRALDGVLRLTPIRYRFRPGTGHPAERQIGLSAQDVRRVFPDLVTEDAQGYLSLAYPNMTAVLVGAMQEQQDQIREQQATITSLQDELATLKDQLARLGARLGRLETLVSEEP